jgi:hypothetical protein
LIGPAIDFIPFDSLSVGSWQRFPRDTADETADTTFAYMPFEGGERRLSWVMFHAKCAPSATRDRAQTDFFSNSTHFRISVPFASIDRLTCDSVPEMPTAISVTLTLKKAPVFDAWDVQVEQWKTTSSFIETDDVLVHRLTGTRSVSRCHTL